MTAKQTPLFDLLRMHADDIHSAHGHNKSSTLLSQAADHIVALEAERDRILAANSDLNNALRQEAVKCDQLRRTLITAAHDLEVARVWNGHSWGWGMLHGYMGEKIWKRLRAAIDATKENDDV